MVAEYLIPQDHEMYYEPASRVKKFITPAEPAVWTEDMQGWSFNTIWHVPMLNLNLNHINTAVNHKI